MSLAIFCHFGERVDNLFDVTRRLQNRMRRHEHLQETQRRADDLSRRRRHQKAHVVDQQLRQVVRKQISELVEDSRDRLKIEMKGSN